MLLNKWDGDRRSLQNPDSWDQLESCALFTGGLLGEKQIPLCPIESSEKGSMVALRHCAALDRKEERWSVIVAERVYSTGPVSFDS